MPTPTILNQAPSKLVAIGDLKPHPKNPRQGDVGAIHASLDAHGFYGTIVVQKSTGFILAGNHRWLAAQQAEMEKIPVVYVDVDEETALRILLADNRTSDIGGYDEAQLLALLSALEQTPAGLDGLGYDTDDLQELALLLGEPPAAGSGDGGSELSRADELLDKWKVELGQTWRIGPHILRCGDSTIEGAWNEMFEGVADALWTDPPYGVSYESAGRRLKELRGGKQGTIHGLIANDSLTPEETGRLFEDALDQLKMKKGASIYVAAPSGPLHVVFQRPLVERGWLRQGLIWLKNQMVMGRQDYHYKHEPILYGWTPGAKHVWNADRSQTAVLEFDRPLSSDEHPTMKPVDLIAYCIRNSTNPGDVVLDPFAGSGSTLVACQETGRVGAGIELEPKYASVVLERLSMMDLTPELVE